MILSLISLPEYTLSHLLDFGQISFFISFSDCVPPFELELQQFEHIPPRKGPSGMVVPSPVFGGESQPAPVHQIEIGEYAANLEDSDDHNVAFILQTAKIILDDQTSREQVSVLFHSFCPRGRPPVFLFGVTNGIDRSFISPISPSSTRMFVASPS
jgi:hypothetical protein